MSERSTVPLSIGSHVWWHGDSWEVRALREGHVELARHGQLTAVAVADVARAAMGSGDTQIDPALIEEREASTSLILSGLLDADRVEVERQASVILELISDPSPMSPRLRPAADRLGTSVRSLERKIAAYRRSGVAGLVDARTGRRRATGVDPRWDEVCLRVLRSYTYASTPTRSAVLARVAREVEQAYGADQVARPSQATAYRRLDALSRGKNTFGGASRRRSVAERPDGPYGRLRADRPGQYVVLDTNDLDVYAMEPVTLRWVKVQLTVAMDLFSRCVVGLRVTPVSTKAADVANVLYQCLRPGDEIDAKTAFPYHGVPDAVLIGTEVPHERLLAPTGGLPAVFAEAIVVDRGRQYVSSHVVSACARLGISVQPANPHKPTDKPTVERFFRTLREGLLQHLPAYKGPDVYSRGSNVEAQAFYWVSELEQIIREWVTTIYHQRAHEGLAIADVPRAALSPIEAYNIGLARAGGLVLPARTDLAFEFLEVQWRRIQHYGVDIGGLRYDGTALNPYRSRSSAFGGKYKGKWPFYVDVHDVRRVHFKDPADGTWHAVMWEQAPALGAPMSRDAMDYVKRLATETDRHVDAEAAIEDLLRRWSRGDVVERRERNLALRLSSQRTAPLAPEPLAVEEVAELPTVVDLAERRTRRPSEPLRDELDVFEEFPPGAHGYAVMDE